MFFSTEEFLKYHLNEGVAYSSNSQLKLDTIYRHYSHHILTSVQRANPGAKIRSCTEIVTEIVSAHAVKIMYMHPSSNLQW
jgi:hypothetical protein